MWFIISNLISTSALGQWIPDAYHTTAVSVSHWLVSIIVIMRVFAFSAGEVLASLSAFALVAAVVFFAYWSVLSNGPCSLLLYLFQPFRIGD